MPEKIPWSKVRLWELQFEVHNKMHAVPFPVRVVREVQRTPAYRIGCRGTDSNGQLSITVAGEGRFKVNGVEHRLTPGAAFVHLHADPDVEYYYPPSATEPWHFLWISFDGGALKRLIEDVNKRYGYVFNLPLDTGIVPMLTMYKDFPGLVNVLSPLLGAKLCTDIFYELVRDKDAAQQVDAAHSLVTQGQNLMRRTLRDRTSVQDIADQLNVSREHLSRCFKQVTGESPQSYQFRERMNLARQLLRSSSMSCKELAYNLGYDNACSFSRAFSKQVGLSPSAFRQSNL